MADGNLSGIMRMNVVGMDDDTLLMLREVLPPCPLLDAVADEIEARSLDLRSEASRG